MISFSGARLVLPSPCTTNKPARNLHCRTPSLSSSTSTVVSSTEDEALTDANSTYSTVSNGGDVSLVAVEAESDIDMPCEPNTPMPAMTPTTPTDRFTRLNVSSRRAKGESFLHRRLKSVHIHRREGSAEAEVSLSSPRVFGSQGRLPRDASVKVEGEETKINAVNHPTSETERMRDTSSEAESSDTSHVEILPLPKVQLALAHRRANSKLQTDRESRHQPYQARQRQGSNDSIKPTKTPFKLRRKLSLECLPPALKIKMQGEDGKQWLLVGPDVARHLQMGGSVLVRDYVGNVVGWMA